ncbi:MAG TPA: serine/threonine protein kinase, partial [Thiolapillus brandeum]|nr:serine/threonine protein kinase [Thiolapillus brandeum]
MANLPGKKLHLHQGTICPFGERNISSSTKPAMDADLSAIHIPGYQLLKLIGKGASATVYLALQESLNRQVALKILQKFNCPAQAVRFFKEGQMVASMNHPNIITTYDIGSAGSQQFIAMEYLDGGSLRDRIAKGLSPDDALDIIQAIGSALESVHQKGIVHRDIKPENILFHKNGIPKITDFGVAKELDRDMNLTLDGTALGSPYYLSPEQAEGKDLDGRSDIYALGVILFELLARRKPYVGDSQIEVIFGHMNQSIPALPKQHGQYQELVEKMMAKNPDERLASAREMLDHLNRLRGLTDHRPNRKSADLNRNGKFFAMLRNSRLISLVRNHPLLFSMSGIILLLAITILVLNTPSPQTLNTTISSKTKSSTEVSETLVASDRITARPTENTNQNQTAESLSPTPSADTLYYTAIDPNNTASFKANRATSDFSETSDNTDKILATSTIDMTTGGVRDADTDATREERIESLLKKADAALKEYRLTRPKSDNAYLYYNEILKLDPGNKKAASGINKLAGVYGVLSDHA